MPWCGMQIDTSSLEVTASTKRIFSTHLSASVTVDARRPGVVLRKAIKSFVRSRCAAITLDSLLNSDRVVLTAIFMLFCTAAPRTHAYLVRMNTNAQGANSQHLMNAIAEAVIFGARLIHSRTQKRSNAREQSRASLRGENFGVDYDLEAFESIVPHSGSFDALTSTDPSGPVGSDDKDHFIKLIPQRQYGACKISNGECRWLGYLAFVKAFECRPGTYARTIAFLRSKLAQMGYGINTKMGVHRGHLDKTAQVMLSDAKWL